MKKVIFKEIPTNTIFYQDVEFNQSFICCKHANITPVILCCNANHEYEWRTIDNINGADWFSRHETIDEALQHKCGVEIFVFDTMLEVIEWAYNGVFKFNDIFDDT